MRYSLKKDQVRRNFIKKTYKDYLIMKCIYLYFKKRVDKFSFLLGFHKILKSSSSTLIRRYCIVSGRSRGVFRFFRLSRLSLNKLMKARLVNGLRRLTW